MPFWCLREQKSLESDEPRGSLLPLLRRFFGAAGSQTPSSPAYAVLSLLPLVTRKVNCSRKSKGEHLFDLLHAAGHLCSIDNVGGFSTSSALVSHVHFRPHGGPARQSISECGSWKPVRPISCEQTDTQYYFIDYRFFFSVPLDYH